LQTRYQEAQYFLDNLCRHLHLPKRAKVLDIACGRGRHAIYLNKQGYDVTGIDLAIPNISYAKQFENPTLHFFVHDMRSLAYNECFDIAFNLFTSFGYFDTDEEHIETLKTFNKTLKHGGTLVLDYFNSHKMLKNLVGEATMTVDNIDFYISKKIESHKIIKTIKFEDGNKAYEFQEKVSTFSLADFTRFFSLGGFEIVKYFGNYSLEGFDLETSDRLIFICKKIYV
jgi:SAM-dependent methyltransferase